MKKGDLVSVLDDDLRGVVVNIHGNIVEIEDDHGFSHQFQKEKLVIQNHNIYDDFWGTDAEKTSKNISKKHNKNLKTIDLHFHKLVSNPENYESWERFFIQKEKLVEALDYCKANFIKKLIVVHGIGDGILQEMVYEVLRGYPHIEFEEIEFFKHQSASVEVRIL